MKTKNFPVFGVLLLAVSACTPTTTTTTTTGTDTGGTTTTTTTEDPNVPVEVKMEDVANAIKKLAESNINGYNYTIRKYQDNFLNGEVYSNFAQSVDYKLHETGYTQVIKNYEPSKPSLVLDNKVDEGEGRGYYLGEEFFVNGYKSTTSSDNNFINYYENNIYFDFNDLANVYPGLLADAYTAFTNPTSIWPEDVGFIHEENAFTVETVEDSYIATYTAYALEDPTMGYAHEVGSMKVTLDKELNATNVVFNTDLFDPGYTEDVDAHVNSIQYFSVGNFTFGDVDKTAVEPFADGTFTDEQISGAPKHVVEGVAEGNVSEEKVIEILDNLEAYAAGTKTTVIDTFQAEFYNANWEPMGPVNIDSTITAYKDYIVIADNHYEFVLPEHAPYDEVRQVVAGEDGIETTFKVGDSLSYMFNEKANVTKIDSFFNPSAAYSDSSMQFTFPTIVDNGFGVVDSGYSVSEYKLVSAVKTGNKIDIEILSKFTSDLLNSENTYKLTIVDDFLTYYEYSDKETGDLFKYTMTKGELEEYTGELLPFEKPVYPEF